MNDLIQTNLSNRVFRLNKRVVILVFVALLPVATDCFSIGLSWSSVLYLALFIFHILGSNNSKVRLYRPCMMCFIYTIIMFTVYLVHGEFSSIIWLILSLPVTTMIFIDNIKTKNFFLQIIDVIIYSGAVVCILGIIEELTGFNIFYTIFNTIGATANYNAMRLGLTRIIGFTSHAITYCIYLMFLLSLIVYRLSNNKNKIKKNVYIFIYVLAWINALCTVSRSTILMIIITQIILQFKKGIAKTMKKIALMILIISVIMLFTSFLFPNTEFDLVSNFIKMFLGLFDSRIASLMSSQISENTNGIGERLQLYEWVRESIEGSMLFGKGTGESFDYHYNLTNGIYTTMHIKNSIEVQYLYTLFHYGVIAMVSQIMMYFSLIRLAFKRIRPKTYAWEKGLDFNFVVGITFVMYLIQFFAINQATDRYIFNIYMYLLFTYNANKIYSQG